MSAKGVVIPDISDRKIDLIVKARENELNQTSLNVFASFGYNSWIQSNTYPYEFAALNKIVLEFIEEYLPEYYFNRLQDEKEELTDLTEANEEMRDEVDENLESIHSLEEENEALLKKLRDNSLRILEVKSNIKLKKKAFEEIKEKLNE